MGVHTSKNYEVELENLRTRVMTMGGRVESQVRLAILSYSEEDIQLAQQVLLTEREINQEQLATDQMCSEVIALRQPAAKDLRLLLGVIGVLAVVVFSELAIALVNWATMLFASPRQLPRLDYSRGLPESARSLVAVPTMLGSRAGIDTLVEALEVR